MPAESARVRLPISGSDFGAVSYFRESASDRFQGDMTEEPARVRYSEPGYVTVEYARPVPADSDGIPHMMHADRTV